MWRIALPLRAVKHFLARVLLDPGPRGNERRRFVSLSFLGAEAGSGMLRDVVSLTAVGTVGGIQSVVFLSNMQEQRGELTCCLCSPATVGTAGAIPDHQLSALHHGLKRLSVKCIAQKTARITMRGHSSRCLNTAEHMARLHNA